MIEIHVGSLNHGVLIDNKAGGHGQGPAVITKTSPSFVVISRPARRRNIVDASFSLRAPEKNKSTPYLSFGPSTALHPPPRISIRAGECALQTKQNPAQSCGFIYFRDPK